MGYNTDFEGELKFTKNLSAEQLAVIEEILDTEDFEEYINLEVIEGNTGLQWSGGEKTRGMEKSVNFVIAEARKSIPDFGLSGVLKAQGEEFDDRWMLKVLGDKVWRENIKTSVTTCPHCSEKFETL